MMKEVDLSKICAFCKRFIENSEDLGETKWSKCQKTGKFTSPDSTCNDHIHIYMDDMFYTDINDDD